ncbi:golgin subfamily A member 6-like protein 6, partial [Limulus polyphemus]|uniref:Golgin subfamily A member 6-like protein 6 n=1 Tax=Limulus polyphemus TaxID=6850 RepID=A0ABM1BZ69_LIMPO
MMQEPSFDGEVFDETANSFKELKFEKQTAFLDLSEREKIKNLDGASEETLMVFNMLQEPSFDGEVFDETVNSFFCRNNLAGFKETSEAEKMEETSTDRTSKALEAISDNEYLVLRSGSCEETVVNQKPGQDSGAESNNKAVLICVTPVAGHDIKERCAGLECAHESEVELCTVYNDISPQVFETIYVSLSSLQVLPVYGFVEAVCNEEKTKTEQVKQSDDQKETPDEACSFESEQREGNLETYQYRTEDTNNYQQELNNLNSMLEQKTKELVKLEKDFKGQENELWSRVKEMELLLETAENSKVGMEATVVELEHKLTSKENEFAEQIQNMEEQLSFDNCVISNLKKDVSVVQEELLTVKEKSNQIVKQLKEQMENLNDSEINKCQDDSGNSRPFLFEIEDPVSLLETFFKLVVAREARSIEGLNGELEKCKKELDNKFQEQAEQERKGEELVNEINLVKALLEEKEVSLALLTEEKEEERIKNIEELERKWQDEVESIQKKQEETLELLKIEHESEKELIKENLYGNYEMQITELRKEIERKNWEFEHLVSEQECELKKLNEKEMNELKRKIIEENENQITILQKDIKDKEIELELLKTTHEEKLQPFHRLTSLQEKRELKIKLSEENENQIFSYRKEIKEKIEEIMFLKIKHEEEIERIRHGMENEKKSLNDEYSLEISQLKEQIRKQNEELQSVMLQNEQEIKKTNDQKGNETSDLDSEDNKSKIDALCREIEEKVKELNHLKMKHNEELQTMRQKMQTDKAAMLNGLLRENQKYVDQFKKNMNEKIKESVKMEVQAAKESAWNQYCNEIKEKDKILKQLQEEIEAYKTHLKDVNTKLVPNFGGAGNIPPDTTQLSNLKELEEARKDLVKLNEEVSALNSEKEALESQVQEWKSQYEYMDQQRLIMSGFLTQYREKSEKQSQTKVETDPSLVLGEISGNKSNLTDQSNAVQLELTETKQLLNQLREKLEQKDKEEIQKE